MRKHNESILPYFQMVSMLVIIITFKMLTVSWLQCNMTFKGHIVIVNTIVYQQNSITTHNSPKYNYSPHSFTHLKSKLNRQPDPTQFSLIHNNVRSLKQNLENFQTHLLNEHDFPFSVIGVTETRIRNANFTDFNPTIPGYILNSSQHLFQREVLVCTSTETWNTQ